MNIEKALREKIRAQGKEPSTADAYLGWWKRYLGFCRHCRIGKETKAETAVERFLSMLANERDVSANTQNQAFSALCYVYRHVLARPLIDVSALRAKRPDRIRDVVDESELLALFDELSGVALLAARMMYASSFRIGELGRLRIKDLDFNRKQIVIRSAKGAKDRIVGFPEILHSAVEMQVESMRVQWKHDLAEGLNGVSLPKAWSRKSASSHLDFSWWYLFSSDNYSRCPKSGRLLRHHRDMGHIARQIKEGSQRAGITKRITSHCLRHSFATHSIENGVPIHTLQRLMGHNDIRTTETYLHVAKDGPTSAKSPLERLLANPRPRVEQAEAEKKTQLRIYG